MSTTRRGIRRDDFRQVTPTDDERADWLRRHPNRPSPPWRAEHLPCGTRMWYSGIGIGSHLRACAAFDQSRPQALNDYFGPDDQLSIVQVFRPEGGWTSYESGQALTVAHVVRLRQTEQVESVAVARDGIHLADFTVDELVGSVR